MLELPAYYADARTGLRRVLLEKLIMFLGLELTGTDLVLSLAPCSTQTLNVWVQVDSYNPSYSTTVRSWYSCVYAYARTAVSRHCVPVGCRGVGQMQSLRLESTVRSAQASADRQPHPTSSLAVRQSFSSSANLLHCTRHNVYRPTKCE